MIGAGLAQELRRKAFHMLSAAYAVLFMIAGRETSLAVIGSGIAVIAVIEAVRLRNPRFNEALIRGFGGIHRTSEVNKPSGILWTAAGSFTAILLFPRPDVVLASILYLSAGDAAAGIVGRGWGRLRYGGRSLEGSLACFLACWVVGMLVLSPPEGRPAVMIGALAATLAEALPIPPNDNFWLPVISGAALMAACL